MVESPRPASLAGAPLDERAVQHLLRWLAKRALYPVDGGDALSAAKLARCRRTASD